LTDSSSFCRVFKSFWVGMFQNERHRAMRPSASFFASRNFSKVSSAVVPKDSDLSGGFSDRSQHFSLTFGQLREVHQPLRTRTT
jgi:hypothetical protein